MWTRRSVFWHKSPQPQKSVQGSPLDLHLHFLIQNPFTQLHDTSWIKLSGATSFSVVCGLNSSSIKIHPYSSGSLMSTVSCSDVVYCLSWCKALRQCCLNAPRVGGIFSLFTSSFLYRCTLVCDKVSKLENVSRFFRYPQHTIFSNSHNTLSDNPCWKSVRAKRTSLLKCSFRNSLANASLIIPLNSPTV